MNEMKQLFDTREPIVRELYEALLAELKTFGEVIVEPKKTSIHLKHRTAFAGVHPKKTHFTLNIVSASAIASSRIKKVEQVSKNRFHNEIDIRALTDIDDELISWLQTAYNLTS